MVLSVSYDGSHGSNLGYDINANQVPLNTAGFATASLGAPYPLWSYVKEATNGARSNYHALTVEAKRRFSKGLQFNSSYVFAKNLSNEGGYDPTAFAAANGGVLTDRFNPNVDYGNIPFTRRNRFLTTALYDLPFGRGHMLGGDSNRLVDSFIGGWETAAVLVFQSGSFLTVTNASADPAGNGFPNTIGSGGGGSGGGRADIVPGVDRYLQNRSAAGWINSKAFAIPANNIGRDPNSPVGAVNGPGTEAVSLSLFKSVALKENVKLQVGVAAANLFNHVNLGTPNTNLSSTAFGTITSTQTTEGASARAVQISGRITF